MDLLNDKVSKLYFKFLAAAFGSALISSIYGLVDMIVVGQYHGPDGAAAMAVISPIWNIIYSFGLLCGIGGSVLFSFEKGKSDNIQAQNAYFTGSALDNCNLLRRSAFISVRRKRRADAFVQIIPYRAEDYSPRIRIHADHVRLFAQRLGSGTFHQGSTCRRYLQCIRRLFLRVYTRHGYRRCRTCNSNGSLNLTHCHVHALLF